MFPTYLQLIFTLFSVVVTQNLFEGDICKNVRGTVWTCKKIRECRKAAELLEAGKNPLTCGFKDGSPVVCCEPDRPSVRPPPTFTQPTKRPNPSPTRPSRPSGGGVTPPKRRPPTPRPSGAGAKARQKCKEYSEYVFIKIQGWDDEVQIVDSCNQLESLILGGKNARAREFPHIAQIGYGEQNRIRWSCGGSLISPNYVLSAAHCTDLGNAKRSVLASWVRLGEYNTATTSDELSGDAKPVVYRISQRINHPDYKKDFTRYDIALYKLATNVKFDEYIRPVCLHTETAIPQTYATVIGWGKNEFGGGKPLPILQKVNVTLRSTRECSPSYPPDGSRPYGIEEDSMLCAGDVKKDSCQGDSGGPLQISHPSLYCMHSQVGVVSFGKGCGIAPGVYTRVSNFIPWIESYVWK